MSTGQQARAYAESVRRALGGVGWTPSVEDLIERAMGVGSIHKGRIRSEVTVGKLNGSPLICTASRLTPARTRWCLAHAFGTWAMRADGIPESDVLRLRSRVAAELLLPSDMALRVFRRSSATVVADEFVMPVAATLLREGELLRQPTALVVRARYARVRGDDAGRLPTELWALELLASRRGIGVTRHPVPEDGGVILRIAA